MRKNESKKVKEAMENLGLKLNVVDASEVFYRATTLVKDARTKPLNQTVHPEEKRKIIGDAFMTVAEEEIRKLHLEPSEVFLAQGTLRPGAIFDFVFLFSGSLQILLRVLQLLQALLLHR